MRLNHAVLYVRDAEATACFYEQALGFRRVIRPQHRRNAVFMTAPGSANDHDIAFFSIGPAGPSGAGTATVGLYHLAWEVETLEDLERIGDRLARAGALVGATDHGVSKSVYARDPDGIELEVAWVVPPALLDEQATEAARRGRPLDLPAEKRRFGSKLPGRVTAAASRPITARAVVAGAATRAPAGLPADDGLRDGPLPDEAPGEDPVPRWASVLGLARSDAIDAVVKALRTGELSAARSARRHLAAEVQLLIEGGESTAAGGEPRRTIAGAAAVERRLAGAWPETSLLGRGVWSAPQLDEAGRSARLAVSFEGLGAVVRGAEMCLRFDGDDCVEGIELRFEARPLRQASVLVPEVVAAVDGALANGTPMVVAYTSGSGRPALAVRPSVQCFSATQLCLWEREAALVDSLQHDPAVSLLYQDGRAGTTFVIAGRARVALDAHDRGRVFRLIPEVERNRDPDQRGAAVLIDVELLRGTTPGGPLEIRVGGGGG